MVKNSKLFLSSALVSSILLSNIASADTSYKEDFYDLVDQKSVSIIGKPKDPNKEWGVLIERGLTLKNQEEIDAYGRMEKNQKKAYKNAGGEGTLRPDAPGASQQKWGRRAKKGTMILLKVGTDIAVSSAVRSAADCIIEQLIEHGTPYVGRAAAAAASKATSGITKYDPTGYLAQGTCAVASNTAKGEFQSQVVKGKPYIEAAIRAIPTVAKGAYHVSKATVFGLRKAYTWGSSWFGSNKESAEDTQKLAASAD
jgi:hypothetical protein